MKKIKQIVAELAGREYSLTEVSFKISEISLLCEIDLLYELLIDICVQSD